MLGITLGDPCNMVVFLLLGLVGIQCQLLCEPSPALSHSLLLHWGPVEGTQCQSSESASACGATMLSMEMH